MSEQVSEEEIKIQDLIEHIRFGTQLKYDIKSYILAMERFIRFIYKKTKRNRRKKLFNRCITTQNRRIVRQ